MRVQEDIIYVPSELFLCIVIIKGCFFIINFIE